MDDLHDHLHSSKNTLDLVEAMIRAHPHAKELWERGRECSTGSVFGNHGVYLREEEETVASIAKGEVRLGRSTGDCSLMRWPRTTIMVSSS